MAEVNKSRVAWVDSAKGIAVLLVVLTHASAYLKVIGAPSATWTVVNEALSMMRMPLFFMLAGMFAMSWARKPWGELLRSKVLLLMWVYFAWVLIRFIYFSFVPNLVAPNESASILRLLVQAVWSSTPTWFLYALAVFFVAAKILIKTPLWLQFASTGLVSAIFMADWITLPSSLWTGLAEYFVFFLLGLHGSQFIRDRAATRSGSAVMVLTLPVWGILASTAVMTNAVEAPGVRFLLAVAAMPAGIGLGIIFQRSVSLQYAGRQTLPIYLGHTLVQGGIAVLLTHLPLSTLMQWSGWLPIAFVLVSTFVSLAVYVLITRLGLRGVYDLPKWVQAVARSGSAERGSTRLHSTKP